MSYMQGKALFFSQEIILFTIKQTQAGGVIFIINTFLYIGNLYI